VRRYTPDGQPLGVEFQANTFTTSNQGSPTLAMDASGKLVVVWESSGQDGSGWGVVAQRYGSDGTALGGEFRVNSYTTTDQELNAVAMESDGDFVVVWQTWASPSSDSAQPSIMGQRFASSGAPVGAEFEVTAVTTYGLRHPSVAMDPTGGFVVAWMDSWGPVGEPAVDSSIRGQRFGVDGTPVGDEFQAEDYTTDFQQEPAVAIDPRGRFVVTWNSFAAGGTDTDQSSVQARRYLIPIFADGFESGDTSAWTASVP
jgi:hypothetical protein